MVEGQAPEKAGLQVWPLESLRNGRPQVSQKGVENRGSASSLYKEANLLPTIAVGQGPARTMPSRTEDWRFALCRGWTPGQSTWPVAGRPSWSHGNWAEVSIQASGILAAIPWQEGWRNLLRGKWSFLERRPVDIHGPVLSPDPTVKTPW